MNKRWSDFLFAVAVRVVCGLIIGSLAGLLLGWRLILIEAAGEHNRLVIFWLAAWAVGGALVAAFRIPHWQRPSYEGVGDSEQDRGTNRGFREARADEVEESKTLEGTWRFVKPSGADAQKKDNAAAMRVVFKGDTIAFVGDDSKFPR